jgi:hypothetical protein
MDLPVVEDLGTVECQGAGCGRMVAGRWVPSIAVRVRVAANDRILCPVCGCAAPAGLWLNPASRTA